MALYKVENIIPQAMGEYRANQSYSKNNIVSFNNNSYILRVNNSIGVIPTDTTNWSLLIRGIDEETIRRIKDELRYEIKTEILRELNQ